MDNEFESKVFQEYDRHISEVNDELRQIGVDLLVVSGL